MPTLYHILRVPRVLARIIHLLRPHYPFRLRLISRLWHHLLLPLLPRLFHTLRHTARPLTHLDLAALQEIAPYTKRLKITLPASSSSPHHQGVFITTPDPTLLHIFRLLPGLIELNLTSHTSAVQPLLLLRLALEQTAPALIRFEYIGPGIALRHLAPCLPMNGQGLRKTWWSSVTRLALTFPASSFPRNSPDRVYVDTGISAFLFAFEPTCEGLWLEVRGQEGQVIGCPLLLTGRWDMLGEVWLRGWWIKWEGTRQLREWLTAAKWVATMRMKGVRIVDKAGWEGVYEDWMVERVGKTPRDGMVLTRKEMGGREEEWRSR